MGVQEVTPFHPTGEWNMLQFTLICSYTLGLTAMCKFPYLVYRHTGRCIHMCSLSICIVYPYVQSIHMYSVSICTVYSYVHCIHMDNFSICTVDPSTGKIVVGVYLIIQKAFDAIDHPNLLKKLYSLGIRGNFYIWIKSYLTNRSQFVM